MSKLIEYPLTVEEEGYAVWIEDATGLKVCDFRMLFACGHPGNHEAIVDLAELIVIATNALRFSVVEKVDIEPNISSELRVTMTKQRNGLYVLAMNFGAVILSVMSEDEFSSFLSAMTRLRDSDGQREYLFVGRSK